MNGIILINKPTNITSRDVVNIAVKKLGIKKIGHTGTLDPLATGVMVLCIGKATKLVDLLTSEKKEYIAEVTFGIKTDTLDITGKILEEKKVEINKQQIINILKTFLGKYYQEVPIFSAVKVNGRKLYEYARNEEVVKLPTREVEIYNIKLLDYINLNGNLKITFKCLVSKGTYIRSLIRDICNKLNTIGTMSSLIRTKQGKFNIKDCINIDDISQEKIINIKDCLNISNLVVNENLKFKIINGQILDNIYKEDLILFLDKKEHLLAIYKKYEKNKNKIKPYLMLYDREE